MIDKNTHSKLGVSAFFAVTLSLVAIGIDAQEAGTFGEALGNSFIALAVYGAAIVSGVCALVFGLKRIKTEKSWKTILQTIAGFFVVVSPISILPLFNLTRRWYLRQYYLPIENQSFSFSVAKQIADFFKDILSFVQILRGTMFVIAIAVFIAWILWMRFRKGESKGGGEDAPKTDSGPGDLF